MWTTDDIALVELPQEFFDGIDSWWKSNLSLLDHAMETTFIQIIQYMTIVWWFILIPIDFVSNWVYFSRVLAIHCMLLWLQLNHWHLKLTFVEACGEIMNPHAVSHVKKRERKETYSDQFWYTWHRNPDYYYYKWIPVYTWFEECWEAYCKRKNSRLQNLVNYASGPNSRKFYAAKIFFAIRESFLPLESSSVGVPMFKVWVLHSIMYMHCWICLITWWLKYPYF